MASLGVHEHWNNATSKQYTRNLGTEAGIELVSSDPLACDGNFDLDGDVDGTDLADLIPNAASADIAKFARNFGKNACQ